MVVTIFLIENELRRGQSDLSKGTVEWFCSMKQKGTDVEM